MQYCPKCKVHIRGEKKNCPLCQGNLKKSEKPTQDQEGVERIDDAFIAFEQDNPFPVLKKRIVSTVTFFKIVAFLALALILAMLTTFYLSVYTYTWTLIVCVTAIAVWADLGIAAYYRNNAVKLVNTQGWILMIASFFIDRFFGNRGWSLHWVIPFIFLFLAVVTLIIERVSGLRIEEYLMYVVANIFLSFLQMIFVKNGMNTYIYPAVISISLLLILGLGLFIFKGKELCLAWQKYFHL